MATVIFDQASPLQVSSCSRDTFVAYAEHIGDQLLGNAVALAGSQGSVLDPVVAIHGRMTVEPDQSVSADLVYGIGDSRAAALGLVEKYQEMPLCFHTCVRNSPSALGKC